MSIYCNNRHFFLSIIIFIYLANYQTISCLTTSLDCGLLKEKSDPLSVVVRWGFLIMYADETKVVWAVSHLTIPLDCGLLKE